MGSRHSVVSVKQVDGVTMDLPLRPTLSNLFLIFYESKWLAKCSVQFRPKYYCYYVDKILPMLKKNLCPKDFKLSELSTYKDQIYV